MDRYRVLPGATVSLADWDPADSGGFGGDKSAARDRLRDLVERLADLQYLLWAEDRNKLLVVLQALDTGGKDGIIRHVFGGVNPQGVRVANFKAPTPDELAHDYLWRVHARTPGSGEIVVFNRSHYEDVLVVRVLGLVAQERWERRYTHINDFEALLVDEGTTILKFFLHISKDEQRKRLQERLDDPAKNWKFSVGDLDHRARWDDYTAAFEAVLERTSTEHAPWYVVPADRKWYRDLVVAETIVSTLEGLAMHLPPPEEGLGGIVVI
ncbi:MAG TPA: polyphosphate kinase 2 family protein [Acidimicrobiia bacterium]|jgi:PPK2 family polyphosphate:nucleotide phosphotransferase